MLTNIIVNKDSAMEYCLATGLLPRTRSCPTCEKDMALIKDSKVSDRHRWYCRIKSSNLKSEQSLHKDRYVFRKINHDQRKFYKLYISGNMDTAKNIQHELRISSSTYVDWAMFCCENTASDTGCKGVGSSVAGKR